MALTPIQNIRFNTTRPVGFNFTSGADDEDTLDTLNPATPANPTPNDGDDADNEAEDITTNPPPITTPAGTSGISQGDLGLGIGLGTGLSGGSGVDAGTGAETGNVDSATGPAGRAGAAEVAGAVQTDPAQAAEEAANRAAAFNDLPAFAKAIFSFMAPVPMISAFSNLQGALTTAQRGALEVSAAEDIAANPDIFGGQEAGPDLGTVDSSGTPLGGSAGDLGAPDAGPDLGGLESGGDSGTGTGTGGASTGTVGIGGSGGDLGAADAGPGPGLVGGSGGDLGAGGSGGDSGLGGGEGGGTVICTELHRQGFFSDMIFEAEEKYGKLLRANDPAVYEGYMVWAPTCVRWMQVPGWRGEAWTWFIKLFAKPWATDVANHLMVPGCLPNVAGHIINVIGEPICRLIGKLKNGGRNARVSTG